MSSPERPGALRISTKHPDRASEALLTSALADARRRKIGRITVFFDRDIQPAMLREALSDPRIASVGAKQAAFCSELPEDLREDRRVGRLWEPGGWMLPEPA
ncbi:MAG TPA: hypothetical protein VKA90_02775, partial [Beijerinckiaceae bacterium]|nr:hypothetical protein [Beijerinckiaceae bacterium]